MSGVETELYSSSKLPFALAIPTVRRPAMVEPAYFERQDATMAAFLADFPGIVASSGGTPTRTQKITHCTSNTVVHDGNNTFNQEDEKQDDSEGEDWTDD